jgi:hypothetical protein
LVELREIEPLTPRLPVGSGRKRNALMFVRFPVLYNDSKACMFYDDYVYYDVYGLSGLI